MSLDAAPVAATPAVSPPGTLLLVDDEENILSAMKRLLRRDGYRILTASGGEVGLQLLAENPVDVIISDQRMPGMCGVEFLRRAKDLYPHTVRMVLSGYTELDSVTNAINEGAIYKFLTKPWDDDQLRANIAEAFQHKNLADENRRLSQELQQANRELAAANARLREMVDLKQERIALDEVTLDVLHEVLQLVPWPLVGLDDQDRVAAMNGEAEHLFGDQGLYLGSPAVSVFPTEVGQILVEPWGEGSLALPQGRFRYYCRPMGRASAARGRVLLLIPEGGPHD